MEQGKSVVWSRGSWYGAGKVHGMEPRPFMVWDRESLWYGAGKVYGMEPRFMVWDRESLWYGAEVHDIGQEKCVVMKGTSMVYGSNLGILYNPQKNVTLHAIFLSCSLDMKCNSHSVVVKLHPPSLNPADQSCFLQKQPLLFSCVASDPSLARLCPCRDYQPQQMALCKNCG